jgi:AcrR family transcriptional regulator
MKDPSVWNSHSMSAAAPTLKPRKSPVQARSALTIETLHIATVQVLTQQGLSRCTTTRIAARAGMSVGSLYQYYPNRDALLAAVLEKHLDGVSNAVERACREARGKPVGEMASALVGAFLAAKLGDPEKSKALYAVAGARGGAELAARVHKRMAAAVAALLASAPDAHFDDPAVTSTFALAALVGPVRSLLEGHATAEFEASLERQLVLLLASYLQAHQPRLPAGQRNSRKPGLISDSAA